MEVWLKIELQKVSVQDYDAQVSENVPVTYVNILGVLKHTFLLSYTIVNIGSIFSQPNVTRHFMQRTGA